MSYNDDRLELGWLQKQIQSAKANIRKIKLYSPYIFPEWQELQLAEVVLQRAKERHAAARKRWDELGANEVEAMLIKSHSEAGRKE